MCLNTYGKRTASMAFSPNSTRCLSVVERLSTWCGRGLPRDGLCTVYANWHNRVGFEKTKRALGKSDGASQHVRRRLKCALRNTPCVHRADVPRKRIQSCGANPTTAPSRVGNNHVEVEEGPRRWRSDRSLVVRVPPCPEQRESPYNYHASPGRRTSSPPGTFG